MNHNPYAAPQSESQQSDNAIENSQHDRLWRRGKRLLTAFLVLYCGFPVVAFILSVVSGRGDGQYYVIVQALAALAFGSLLYTGSHLGKWVTIVMASLSFFGTVAAIPRVPALTAIVLVCLSLFYGSFVCVLLFSKSVRVFFLAQRDRSMDER